MDGVHHLEELGHDYLRLRRWHALGQQSQYLFFPWSADPAVMISMKEWMTVRRVLVVVVDGDINRDVQGVSSMIIVRYPG